MTQAKRTLSHEVWSATSWNTLMLPTRFAVGIVTSVLYYRLLSLEQVGLMFLLTSLASTIGLYADLGIERALPRYLPEVERSGGRSAVRDFMNQIIRLKLAILLLLSIGLNLLAGPLIDHMANQQIVESDKLAQRIVLLRQNDPNDAEIADLEHQVAAQQNIVREIEVRGRWFVLAVTSLLILGAVFDVYMQFLTAYFKQRAWNLINLATTLLQPLLVTAFLLLGWGIPGVLLGLVVTPLVSIALAAWQTRQAMRGMVEHSVAGASAPNLTRRFSRFAAVSYLMQVSTWFYDLSFVVFVLSASLGLGELAIISFAYKFAKDFLGYVWTPLGGIVTPLLTRVRVDRDERSLRDAHASLTRILLLLLVPSAIGLAVLTPAIVAVLFPKYTAGTTLMIIFIGFTFAESLLSIPLNVLMVYERYAVVIMSRLVALLSVPAVLFAFPHYGLIGVAVAVGLVRVLSRLVTVIYAVFWLKLTLPLGFAARVALASSSFAVVLLLILRRWPINTLAISASNRMIVMLPLLGLVLLGATLYLLVLRLTGGLDESERRRLLGMRLPFKQLLSRVL